MSYGDCQAQLRNSLTWLLTHRPPPDIDLDVAGQYRDTLLSWCREALAAACAAPIASASVVEPVHDLRHRLDAAAAPRPRPRLSDLLAQDHQDPQLTTWQQVAKAAVLAGRELHIALAQPDDAGAHWAVVKDAADLVRAVVALDDQYADHPDHPSIPYRSDLGRTALAVSAIAADAPLDYRTDTARWQPQPRPRPVSRRGFAGATQAQYAVAAALHHLPPARALRDLLLEQARLSLDAAQVADAAASPTAPRLHSRTTLYRKLVVAARDVDGNVGETGAQEAVPAAATAAVQAASARRVDPPDQRQIDQLVHACQLVDYQVRQAISRGFQERVYLVPATGRGERHVRDIFDVAGVRWRPTTPGEPVALRILAARELPTPPRPAEPPAARSERAAFARLLNRPGPHATGHGGDGAVRSCASPRHLGP